MLASALNFAIGFFGYPFEGQYQQSITIESKGVRIYLRAHLHIAALTRPKIQFNNTLAPYKTYVRLYSLCWHVLKRI